MIIDILNLLARIIKHLKTSLNKNMIYSQTDLKRQSTIPLCVTQFALLFNIFMQLLGINNKTWPRYRVGLKISVLGITSGSEQ